MAITNFIPELWSAAVQMPFEKALVFGQPTVSNREYEGPLQQQGDTVHVTSITAPTINSYDKTTDITIEDLTDTSDALVVDQGDYFAFRVNDVDRVQAAGDFQGAGLEEAGVGLRDKLDRYIANLYYAGTLAGNKLGRRIVVNGGTGKAGAGQETAYDILVDLAELLDGQSVPTVGRYVVIPPKFNSALRRDVRFTRVDGSGSDQTLRNGIVGRAVGFDVLVSNNLQVLTTGSDSGDTVVCAGIPGAVSVAQQIVETEAMRSEKRFADNVRGLNIYGAKVFRPNAIATTTVTFAAGTGVDTVVVPAS